MFGLVIDSTSSAYVYNKYQERNYNVYDLSFWLLKLIKKGSIWNFVFRHIYANCG